MPDIIRITLEPTLDRSAWICTLRVSATYVWELIGHADTPQLALAQASGWLDQPEEYWDLGGKKDFRLVGNNPGAYCVCTMVELTSI